MLRSTSAVELAPALSLSSITVRARTDDATTPVLVTPHRQELELLSQEIACALIEQEQLAREFASQFLDCSERAIRLGWLLADAHRLVTAADGGWQVWLSSRGISYNRARRLQRLSTFFSRDLSDYNRRQAAGYEVEGLAVGIGPALREQLLATKVQSQNQLLRLVGLKSESPTQKSAQPKPLKRAAPQSQEFETKVLLPPVKVTGQSNGATAAGSDVNLLDPLQKNLDRVLRQLSATDFSALSIGQRQKLIETLHRFAHVYSQLRNRF